MSEIKPIAWTSETQLSAVVNSGDGIMAKDSGRWKIALYDQSAIDHLTAERDAAVADAKRYRWLKKGGPIAVGYLEMIPSSYVWDKAIDSAMKQQEQGK